MKTSHVHKLKKHKYKTGNMIYFCTLPDCHYKLDAALVVGKRSICNICGAEFIMNEYSLKLVRPHCNDCGKVKVKDAEGRGRFIKKVDNKVLLTVATDTTNDLRSRLDSLSAATADDGKDI